MPDVYKRVAFVTIGCRANQADSSRMASILPEGCQVVEIDSPICDVVVINTCAVTARAESDCRKLIRRARKQHPSAAIIVTGCASQVDPDTWSSMPEVDSVIGILERDTIDRYLLNPVTPGIDISAPGGGVLGPTPLAGHRTRPFLKIQDGCSRGCTYCIVPQARGPERSRPADMVRQDLRCLVDAGYKEIVLTGVHLGRWGRDLGVTLNDLIDVLDELASSDVRIRLSSIEPMDLTPELIHRIIAHPAVCPHLHMPLQSADNRILRAMGRGHVIDDYTSLIHAALDANPDVAIGADIMIGFPGEDYEAFENTRAYVSSQPFAYFHVFTYSPRKGTPASRMTNRPRGDEVKDRMRQLIAIDNLKREAFRKSFHGRIFQCLIESREPDGSLIALSGNFIHVVILNPPDHLVPGQLIPLRIDTNVQSESGMPQGTPSM